MNFFFFFWTQKKYNELKCELWSYYKGSFHDTLLTLNVSWPGKYMKETKKLYAYFNKQSKKDKWKDKKIKVFFQRVLFCIYLYNREDGNGFLWTCKPYSWKFLFYAFLYVKKESEETFLKVKLIFFI